MHQYRITKYDPVLRSLSGICPVDEWTSHSDVGRTFDDVLLTEDDYLRVEDAYIKAAVAFLGEASITELTVVGLENHGKLATAPLDGSSMKTEMVPSVLRSLLRDDFWCKLESPIGFIHVGYDYYMYIGTQVACTGASAIAQRSGLFVEAIKSPYA